MMNLHSMTKLSGWLRYWHGIATTSGNEDIFMDFGVLAYAQFTSGSVALNTVVSKEGLYC